MRPGVAVHRFLPVRLSYASRFLIMETRSGLVGSTNLSGSEDSLFGTITTLSVLMILRGGLSWQQEPAAPRKGDPSAWGDAGVPSGRSRMGGIRSPTSLEQQAGTNSSSLRDLRIKGSSTTPTGEVQGPAGSGLASQMPLRELRSIGLCSQRHDNLMNRGSKMNTDQMKGNWKQFVGKAKEKWAS
jgi:hypothetical protein